VRARIQGIDKNKMIRTVGHVVGAQAVQWYAEFRKGRYVRRHGGVNGLQKVDVRSEYL
jgi:hypothetical protein